MSVTQLADTATVALDGPRARTPTDEQEQAIARRAGALLLAAGAGSGKTSVLVERFVRAVLEDDVAPGRILAITFTERAAGELRERVRGRFLELGERAAARDTEAAFVGTFHGFCARLLRLHPLLAGLDPEFAILDEPQAVRLRMLASGRALADFQAQAGEPAVELVASYKVDRILAIVRGIYAHLRSRGEVCPTLPAPALARDCSAADASAARACALLDLLLQRFGERYAELKADRGALDFDDLELYAGTLLGEREELRRGWSERFELLMVDEFQDTNPRQLAILHALQRENLFTVGDEFQSIYGFRNADVSLFRARRDTLAEADASLALRMNFRSRPALLAAINAVFAPRFGDGYAPLLAGREAEEARGGGRWRAGAGNGSTPTADAAPAQAAVELLLTDTRGWDAQELGPRLAEGLPAAARWRQAEARLLAQRIADLVHAGQARAGEVAVLLRSAGDLPVYQRALEERGLRTLATVGSFWGHQQVSDLLAYLQALANPLDELALYCTLASPLVGISSDGLALIARCARAGGDGVWEALRRAGGEAARSAPADDLHVRLAEADRERLARFTAYLLAERAGAARHTIAGLLLRAISASGYKRHVLGLSWGERRVANMHKLVRLARRFEAQEGRDLRGFLDHVAHQREVLERSEPEAPVQDTEPDAVRLMSIHAAKGLEFPVVCVADLGRALGTGCPDLLVDGQRIGLRLVGLDGGEPAPSLAYEQLARERCEAEVEEEDRIVYVAMTRARERLLLSGAVNFERWPRERPGGAPIAWLGPALVCDLAQRAATLGQRACDPREPERPAGAGEWVSDLGGARVRCWLNAPATLGAVLREPSPHPPARGDASPRASETPALARGLAPVPSETSPRAAPEMAFSCTALSELERCGYRYYLERVLGLPENRTGARGGRGGLHARERGVVVHRLLESVDFARPELPSSREVARAARALGASVGREEREEIVRLLGDACASGLATRLGGALDVRRERPFAFSLRTGEPPVAGVLDVLAHERDGRFLIVDYKSDRVSDSEDLRALTAHAYGAQRLVYALAALRSGAAEVEVVHWFLQRPGEWVGASYAAGESERLERELTERAERARKRGFAVSQNPHRALCLTCPGRTTLCSWTESETLRERPV